VTDGVNGMVVDPSPAAIASAVNALAADRARAARLGDAGHDRARLVTWDGVIEQLVGETVAPKTVAQAVNGESGGAGL